MQIAWSTIALLMYTILCVSGLQFSSTARFWMVCTAVRLSRPPVKMLKITNVTRMAFNFTVLCVSWAQRTCRLR